MKGVWDGGGLSTSNSKINFASTGTVTQLRNILIDNVNGWANVDSGQAGSVTDGDTISFSLDEPSTDQRDINLTIVDDTNALAATVDSITGSPFSLNLYNVGDGSAFTGTTTVNWTIEGLTAQPSP